jgi:hypothetical protein
MSNYFGLTLQDWESWGVIVASAIAIYPVYIRVIRPMAQSLKAQFAAVLLLPQLAESVQSIRQELTTNGGSSVKDAIKRIEERQLISSQIIPAIFHEGSFHADQYGRWFDISSSLCKSLRRSEHELRGNSWVSWIEDEEREEIFHEWNQAISDGRDFDECFSFRTDTNEVIKVHVRAYKLLNANNALTGYFGVFKLNCNESVS